jgi:hypothetical protein
MPAPGSVKKRWICHRETRTTRAAANKHQTPTDDDDAAAATTTRHLREKRKPRVSRSSSSPFSLIPSSNNHLLHSASVFFYPFSISFTDLVRASGLLCCLSFRSGKMAPPSLPCQLRWINPARGVETSEFREGRRYWHLDHFRPPARTLPCTPRQAPGRRVS